MKAWWMIHVRRLGWLLLAAVLLMLVRVAMNPTLLKAPYAGVQQVSISTFKDWVRDGHDVVLIDARDWMFYQDGHIAGAKNLPRRGLQPEGVAEKISPLANRNQTVVLYCSSRECTDSTWLASELVKLGYHQVWILDGGWEDWQARGGEVAK